MAGEPAAWRFELQEVSAESPKHRFNDLEEVRAFVSAKLTAVAADDGPDSGYTPV